MISIRREGPTIGVPDNHELRGMGSKQKTQLIKIVILTLCGLGSLCLIALLVGMYLTSPPSSSEAIVNFEVPTGSSSQTIAQRLAAQKLIRSKYAFRIVVRHRGSDRHLHAGTYVLRRNMTLWQIVDEFEKGQVTLICWTVPEGLTAAATAELWETEGLGTAEAFQEASQLPRLLKQYGLEDKAVEGYLFPNTYKFAKGITAEQAVEMMLEEFKQQWTETFDKEARNLELTRHEIVTLASVIEKEAQSKSERPRIAGVFHNRLKRKWRLQADPTVLYALGNPKRLLTRADLKVDSPYNTYRHKGLPPGPIASPGIDSIIAALRPEKTDYFYFVAIGEGKHHFSKTLSEHNRMIRKIRRASRER